MHDLPHFDPLQQLIPFPLVLVQLDGRRLTPGTTYSFELAPVRSGGRGVRVTPSWNQGAVPFFIQYRDTQGERDAPDTVTIEHSFKPALGDCHHILLLPRQICAALLTALYCPVLPVPHGSTGAAGRAVPCESLLLSAWQLQPAASLPPSAPLWKQLPGQLRQCTAQRTERLL